MVSSEKTKLPVIMIVDDVPKNIQVVGNILRESIDCDFTFATNGRQALEKILRNLPDLILLDVMMPEMDGFEVCRELKEHDKTKDVPVIFLTARVETNDIVNGFKLGAVDYVVKPFNPSELLARVRTQLKLREQSQVIREKNDEQKELLHILCHDLANPFSSLISVFGVIKSYEQYEEIRPHLETAAKNGLDVIDLVRKMRKLEDKNEYFPLEVINLPLLVKESMMILRNQIEGKNINMVVHIPEDINVKVEVTSFVNSVLNNLYTNAIKFSFPGSTITTEAEKAEGEVRLSIRDSGIGMPEEMCQDVFDLNKHCSRMGTKGEQGTGFGMPLVKKFVEAYGGSIRILSVEKRDDNSPAHGTTVFLTLPTS